ncbi:MAG: hypothetical protein D6768_07255 [Chloroflexi bacterium]|nr:MAG: hypothetical protein D6768_07255 [Chloroflexota bacterium]
MNAVNHRVKLAGTLYMAGGAVWFLWIVGATALGVPWGQPQTSAFYLAEALFVVMQLLLLIGFFGLW